MTKTLHIDVLFVVSPTNARDAYMPFYYLYLAGYLEKHGFSVEISNPHEATYTENVAKILLDIKHFCPRFVGLPAFVTDYDIILELAKTIRAVFGGTIIVGNAHASICPEDFLLENSPIDVVVRGEGEITVRELLESYQNTNCHQNIKGISYRLGTEIVHSPNRELMSLSDCGMPAYHKIDMSWYAKPRKSIIRRVATVGSVIYIGRGCPFQCTFCASNTVWGANCKVPGAPVIRKRPMIDVLEDLRLLQEKYGFDFFYILDDTFGIRENDILEFCRSYRQSGLKMLWAAETRVRCVQNEEIVKELERSGCIQLDFGVETGSPRLLNIIKKKTTVEEAIRAFQLCRKHGIRTFANILLNLPTETEEDLESTENLLEKISPSYVSIGVTQPYPGTEIYKNLGRPILREEYHELSRLVPPEKFRLCSHHKNLKRLLYSWQNRYGIEGPVEWSLFRVKSGYWMHLLRSRNRLGYFTFLLKDIVLMPARYVKRICKYIA